MKSQCKSCPIAPEECRYKSNPSLFFDGKTHICAVDPRHTDLDRVRGRTHRKCQWSKKQLIGGHWRDLDKKTSK